ncbi:Protein YchQ [BD1-7 clade bacterium]|uniref:Protein YchQ n=1 Tax=BD1-7 clade bacterium TaxID=2029982 RepID=A0A5S9PAL0_9GAMM|nr:Protein YchQ [BD1-7 clade bacterium]CAA0116310.1 Protein YchQ [BD1-7 clade bacterium]
MYMALKHSHMMLALVTFLFFLTRSTWAFQGSALLDKKFVKIAPHIIDTFLLLTAIGLVLVTGFYPFVYGWVTAKIFALVAYIVFGLFTIKMAKNNTQRAVFFTLAVVTFLYMGNVAVSKNALFFLGS